MYVLMRVIIIFVSCPVAFVFNWLGFFAAYCMTKTVAGRYGAISGFGLSVVKWVLILKVNIILCDPWFIHYFTLTLSY